MTREEAAEWFAQILAPFRSGDIAKFSGASKEAVKHWKSGKSVPRFDHIINMGRMIETIANGVEDEMKRPVDPKSVSHMIALAQRVAATETGEQAILARAYLRQVYGRDD